MFLMFFSRNTTSYGLEEFMCIYLHKSSPDFFTSLRHPQNSDTYTTRAAKERRSVRRG